MTKAPNPPSSGSRLVALGIIFAIFILLLVAMPRPASQTRHAAGQADAAPTQDAPVAKKYGEMVMPNSQGSCLEVVGYSYDGLKVYGMAVNRCGKTIDFANVEFQIGYESGDTVLGSASATATHIAANQNWTFTAYATTNGPAARLVEVRAEELRQR